MSRVEMRPSRPKPALNRENAMEATAGGGDRARPAGACLPRRLGVGPGIPVGICSWMLAFSLLLLAVPSGPVLAQTGAVFSALPTDPDPSAHYVFYLHGRIIETSSRRPTHPQFGVYEYDEVLSALAGPGLQVISEQRPPDTEVGAYGRKVADDVRSLLAKGVPPSNIGVVGFSKGGLIAISTSSVLTEPISYVFLAACSDFVFGQPELRVSGRVLSIFEQSDEIGVSCAPLFDRSPAVLETQEIEISTGLATERSMHPGRSGCRR